MTTSTSLASDNNEYATLGEALAYAATILGEDDILSDGADNWDIYNLMSAQDPYAEPDDRECTYSVGFDGSIGRTYEGDCNVEALYNVVEVDPDNDD